MRGRNGSCESVQRSRSSAFSFWCRRPDGRLRHAVAVERERARVAYEATVHRRVDPALAEWSSGNRATLRVYPIPAKGEKKVWLSYDEEIVSGDYVLDLRWGKRLRSADVRIDADGRFVRDGFEVSHERPYHLQLSNTALDRVLTAEADARTEVLAVRDETAHRWYLAAAPRAAAAARPVPPARELVVFWDTSGSAMHQNREALLAFLDLLAARQMPGARVSFIPFDVAAGSPTGTVDALQAIGATNYPALFARMRQVMAEAAAETRFVLVTDGITSLGSRRHIVRAAGELGPLKRPLTVINSSPHADDILLAHIAAATNGWLLDLGRLTPRAAAESAMRVPPPASISSSAVALVTSSRPAEHGARLALAAETEFKNEETRPPVIRPPAASASPEPAGPWQIDGLTTLDGAPLPGTTVTFTAGDQTRTAVSDVHGHVRFRLPSPPSRFTMRAELPGLSTLHTQVRSRVPSGSTVVMDLRILAVSEAITVTAEAPVVEVTRSATASFIAGPSSGSASAQDDALVAGLFAGPDSGKSLAQRRQTLDAVAAKMATIASVDERVRHYLAARAAFGGDKAFHLHAATLLRDDAPQLAVRILSELAEAYPDDSALLRILARILDGWNESEMARLLLQHALEVAASEPQTWRELVLLEARLGNDAALEQVAAAAAATDPLVRAGIVAQVTPLLARWRTLARQESHDLRLHDGAALQVDLMWDTNFSDVDLYVTEPGGEQVMYRHVQSVQGGRLHQDVTGGFGPEIYTVSEPAPGPYEIAVDYYAADETEVAIETLAHVVVHHRTRSGMDRREFILLLTKGKEHRTVATITVGAL